RFRQVAVSINHSRKHFGDLLARNLRSAKTRFVGSGSLKLGRDRSYLAIRAAVPYLQVTLGLSLARSRQALSCLARRAASSTPSFGGAGCVCTAGSTGTFSCCCSATGAGVDATGVAGVTVVAEA